MIKFNATYKDIDIIDYAKNNFMLKWSLIAILIIIYSGWLMNLENVWVCLPEFIDGSEPIASISIKAVMSLIGLFVFPVGVISGYIW